LYIPDQAGAAKELLGALEQLQEEAAVRRREELLSKHGRDGLSEAEKAELQALLRVQTARTAPVPRT
jgi:hypothetical protein